MKRTDASRKTGIRGRPRVRKTRLTLIEVVVGMGVFVLIGTGAYSGLRLTERMNNHYLLEDKALEVLDNAVERLAAEGDVTVPRATAVIRDEFEQSALAADHGATLTCRQTESGLSASVATRGGNRLAQVTLPARVPMQGGTRP